MKTELESMKKAELGLGVPGGATLDQHGISPLGKSWYSRGYLPHRDEIGLLQSITFRLADSLPQEKLKELEVELEDLKKKAELGLGVPGSAEPQLGSSINIEAEKRKRIEAWLDAGMGCCALRHPKMATVMEDTLLKFDGEKYRLLAWCVMPNHVHVLIEAMMPLGGIVQSWKSYTGRWGLTRNAELGLGVPGKDFWMREYWDRYIRNEKHLADTIAYIHNNPAKAGLCHADEKWQWSSSRLLA
jgi:REP element-mobilizing transposase RayT